MYKTEKRKSIQSLVKHFLQWLSFFLINLSGQVDARKPGGPQLFELALNYEGITRKSRGRVTILSNE